MLQDMCLAPPLIWLFGINTTGRASTYSQRDQSVAGSVMLHTPSTLQSFCLDWSKADSKLVRNAHEHFAPQHLCLHSRILMHRWFLGFSRTFHKLLTVAYQKWFLVDRFRRCFKPVRYFWTGSSAPLTWDYHYCSGAPPQRFTPCVRACFCAF